MNDVVAKRGLNTRWDEGESIVPATPSNGPAEELRSAATAAKATGHRALCNLYLSMHH